MDAALGEMLTEAGVPTSTGNHRRDIVQEIGRQVEIALFEEMGSVMNQQAVGA